MIIDSEAELRAGENVVHTTRVAARRLRSTIRVFPDLFDASEAVHLEEELVWWAGLLGEPKGSGHPGPAASRTAGRAAS